MTDVVCPEEKMDNSNLRFNRYSDGWLKRMYLTSGKIGRKFLMLASEGKINHENIMKYQKDLEEADAILDVSGYAIGSNWSFKSNISYVLLLKMARKYNIPIFLLPQSFGPFEYKGIKGKFIDVLLNKYLKYSRITFARENDGMKLLQKHYKVTNVRLATDIVLQNKSIDYSLVLKNCESISSISYEDKPLGIGIIPSLNNFRYANKDTVWKIYYDVIDGLIEKNEVIYLAAHSGEDLKICREIKANYQNNDAVCLIDEELSFMQFEELSTRFKFMIASRFHSIVLGYKKFTPSVILGWAVKYHELAAYFKQEKYVLNTAEMKEASSLIQVIEQMYMSYNIESKKIKECLESIQEASCFEQIAELL